MKHFFIVAGLLVVLFFSGCCNKVQVILLPNADGSVGKVTVSDKGKEAVLDQAWQKVETSNIDKKDILSKDDVESEFKVLFEGMPKEAKIHRVYFKFDSTEIAGRSIDVITQVVEYIKAGHVLQIDVIGYTDRAGDEAYNKVLSLKRAKKIRELLEQNGIDKEMISLDYYGEVNPIVKTADGVAKDVNRRVEITIK